MIGIIFPKVFLNLRTCEVLSSLQYTHIIDLSGEDFVIVVNFFFFGRRFVFDGAVGARGGLHASGGVTYLTYRRQFDRSHSRLHFATRVELSDAINRFLNIYSTFLLF